MSSRSNQLKDEILNQIAEQIKGVSWTPVFACSEHLLITKLGQFNQNNMKTCGLPRRALTS